MIPEFLAHPHYVRVFRAIRERPMRFVHLQLELELHPPQIDRAIKFLVKAGWIRLGAADTATGLPVLIYSLTDRGMAMDEALQTFVHAVNRRRNRLGAKCLESLRVYWHGSNGPRN